MGVAVSHQCEKFAELPDDPGAGPPVGMEAIMAKNTKSKPRKSAASKPRKPVAKSAPRRKPAARTKSRRAPRQKFTVSHHDERDFRTGLRNYAKYRDLGISKATDGMVQAHVIRFVPPFRRVLTSIVSGLERSARTSNCLSSVRPMRIATLTGSGPACWPYTSARIVYSPLPSMFGGRDSSDTTCGCGSCNSAASSIVTMRS